MLGTQSFIPEVNPMKGLTIILGAIAVLLAILVLQHEREHRAGVAAYTETRPTKDEESKRRWVEFYGNKSWEQVQREKAQAAADAAAADRTFSEGVRQALTGKENPWAKQEKDILQQQRH